MFRSREQPDRVAQFSRIKTLRGFVDNPDHAQPRSFDRPLPLLARETQQVVRPGTDFSFSSAPYLQHAVDTFGAPTRGRSAKGRCVTHQLLDGDSPSRCPPNIFARRFRAVNAQADPDRVDTRRRQRFPHHPKMTHDFRVGGDVADRVDRTERKPHRSRADLFPEHIEPVAPNPAGRRRNSVDRAQTRPRESDHLHIVIKAQDRPAGEGEPLEIPARAASRLERNPRRALADPLPDPHQQAHLRGRAGFVQDVVDRRIVVEPDLLQRIGAGVITSDEIMSGRPGPGLFRWCFTVDCQSLGHS